MDLLKIIFITIGGFIITGLPSHASNSNPMERGEPSSATRTQSYRTPLQIDAQEFLAIWKPETLKTTLERVPNNPFFQKFIDYTSTIITVDTLAQFNSPQTLTYDLINDDAIENTPPEVRQAALEPIQEIWQNLIEIPSKNTFASYFLGYAFAYGRDPQDYPYKKRLQVKAFLEEASKKYYVRATNFLLEYPEWRQEGIESNILSIRYDIMRYPEQAIVNYIAENSVKGQAVWKDVKRFEDILIYHTAKPDEYIKAYIKLAECLTEALMVRKKNTMPLRLVIIPALTTISTSTLLMTQGILNITAGSNVIGGVQIGAAVLNVSAAALAYPYSINGLYKIEGWKNRSPLLPPSCSDDEISIQSHLVALITIIINKDEHRGNVLTQLGHKHYVNQLRKIILSAYKGEATSLSAFINPKSIKQLKLNTHH